MDQGPTTPVSASRPPRSRGFSYGSNRSGESESKSKYAESPQDKAKRDSLWNGISKANPNAAITEDQPALRNQQEESTLQNLRTIRHKDAFGNDITDPDLANPTRPRLERPLDTIRNFERAIDDGYKRRSSYRGTDQDHNNDYASKRSSHFGGEYALPNKRHSKANGVTGYGNGPVPNGQHPGAGGGYYGNQGGYAGNGRGPPSRLRYGDRMQSDPQMYGQPKPYPQHGYHESYDTVNTGVTHGSDSTGPWANSTDPSSENSSLDRVTAAKPQTPMDGYGQYPQNGYNGPIMEEQGYGDYPDQDAYGGQNGYPQRNGYPPNGYPPNGYPPREQSSQQPEISSPRQIYARHNSVPMQAQPQQMNGGPRRPMQLNGPQSGPPASNLPDMRREPEKRKSWFSRRFSKKD